MLLPKTAVNLGTLSALESFCKVVGIMLCTLLLIRGTAQQEKLSKSHNKAQCWSDLIKQMLIVFK